MTTITREIINPNFYHVTEGMDYETLCKRINKFKHLFLSKDIKKGEEFSYDYGFSFDEDYKDYPCKCGSKNCCGYIVRAESRWRINKKFAMSNKKNLINNSH